MRYSRLRSGITICMCSKASCPSPLSTAEPTHDRSKRFHACIGNDKIGESILLTSPLQILDYLIGSANKNGRHLQNTPDSNTTPPSFMYELFTPLSPLLREDRRYHHVQLKFIKAFNCGLTDPFNFLGNCPRQTLAYLFRDSPVRQRFGKNTHNIGFPCGKSQHSLASSSNQHWWVRPLRRFRESIEVCNRIIVTAKGQWLVGEKTLEYVNGFFQPAHPYPRRLKCHARLLVLGFEPTRSNPKLEASFREQIKRRHLFCQHHRVPVVIVEHQASNT